VSTDYQAIYRDRAEDYDRLVSAEDADDHLGPALGSIASLHGAIFVDVGAGTGRVTRILLAAGARRVLAFDRSAAMLAIAERRLQREPRDRWQVQVADASALPIADGVVDHAVAGWVFGHLRSWETEWRTAIEAGLREMQRVVRPGGAVIVIETLGTGSEQPSAPTPQLAEYYQWLEKTQGMTRIWVRTDYAFADAATATELTGFFFGPQLAARASQSLRLPECTGLWWRR
jgi:ubiquinone/menaquinone biosynthesis C-methylase UbiE